MTQHLNPHASAQDHAAVAQAIATYLRGHAEAEPAHMRAAFLPGAHVEGIHDGVFTSWDLDTYCALFKGAPAPDEATRLRRIDWVDVTGDAAAAKATLVHGATTFTDYFVLLKVAGEWRIANKVYHGQATGAAQGPA